MHNQFAIEERGAIIPSARRSIHAHKGFCPIRASETMGRYGANKSLLDVPSASSGGSDEVDFNKGEQENTNHNKSLTPKRKKSLPNHQKLDSEVNNVDFAKSINQNEIHAKNHSDVGRETSYYSDNSWTNESINLSTSSNYSNLSSRESPQASSYQPLNQGVIKLAPILLVSVGVLFLGVVTAFYNNTPLLSQESKVAKYNEGQFYQDMDILARRYRITDTPLLKLKTGLSTISEREDTGSFIFLYNSKNKDFDESQFENFVESVASVAAKYLRNNNDTPARHLLVDNLDMQTHGELINRYRHDLEKKGVMLVKELDEVPSRLAMAFHFYCDEYNPLAKKSAVFFTLDLGRCSNTSERKTNTEKHADVEKCLITKWKGVPQDNIRPLLTRVVNVLIDVSNVF